jgi:hypothetical protein
MDISVPVDGRAQFSFATAAIANASLGRMPWADIEQVGPDRYVVAGSWPASTRVKFDRPSTVPVEVAAPRKQDAAHALWPDLK